MIAFDGARAEARAETRPAPCRENWGLRPIVRLQVGHIQEVWPDAPLLWVVGGLVQRAIREATRGAL